MGSRPGGFLYADDEVLTGVTLALKKVDREAKKEWAKAMRTTGTSLFRSAVSKRQHLAQDKMFGTASIRWSMTGKGTAVVRLRPLSGGLGDGTHTRGGRDWALIEFGSASPRGRQMPRRVPTGRVVYGALEPLGSYMGSMALRTVADLIREATGGE